jgi:polyhydroxyalkanoate synthase
MDARVQRDVFTCTTRDEHTLVLWRYSADGGDAPPRTHPVLMCHGFASNRFTFDLNDRVSVAHYMARRGWDTWVVELRGSGKSKKMGPSGAANTSWCFDDHIEDMRAFVEKVHAVAGKPVHVVGHGMGAMLAQCAAAGGVCTEAHMVRSGVSLAGSFVMPESDWKEFLWLWPLVQTCPTIDPDFIKDVLAPMSFRVSTPWDQLFVHHNNVDPAVAREVFLKNWEPIPVSLIAQLRSAVDARGLRSADGASLYADQLGAITVPMLMLAGSKDQQCPPASMRAAAARVAGSTFQCFGAPHGQKHDYGHFDLLVGLHAHEEVWTVVSDFLHQHDSAAGGAHDATAEAAAPSQALAPRGL